MPKPPTLCPHGVLGISKCAVCLAEKEKRRRLAGKTRYKRDRKAYQAEYYRRRKELKEMVDSV